MIEQRAMSEVICRFGAGGGLVGIITQPSPAAADRRKPGILLLNAGLLHRIGPNRLHVKMARRLAGSGFTVLRFDFSGIGDSASSDNPMPFEHRAVQETIEAMDILRDRSGIDRFIPAGICSGADIALRVARADPRVIGAVLINGLLIERENNTDILDAAGKNTAARYYKSRLFNLKRWSRVVLGKSDFKSIRRVIRGRLTGKASAQGRSPRAPGPFDGLLDRELAILLVNSDGSPAWDVYRMAIEPSVGPFVESGKLRVELIRNSDHVFTMGWTQKLLIDLVEDWLARFDRAAPMNSPNNG
jgi:pimeloyl-ACP methyl ester carboxylesterase